MKKWRVLCYTLICILKAVNLISSLYVSVLYARLPTHWDQRSMAGVFTNTLCLILWGVSHWTWSSSTQLHWLTVQCRDLLPLLHVPALWLGLQTCTTEPHFYVSAGELTWVLNACMAGALQTETHSQPLISS